MNVEFVSAQDGPNVRVIAGPNNICAGELIPKSIPPYWFYITGPRIEHYFDSNEAESIRQEVILWIKTKTALRRVTDRLKNS